MAVAYSGTELPVGFLAQVRVLQGNDVQVARVANVDVGSCQWASAALLPVCQHHLAHLNVKLRQKLLLSEKHVPSVHARSQGVHAAANKQHQWMHLINARLEAGYRIV